MARIKKRDFSIFSKFFLLVYMIPGLLYAAYVNFPESLPSLPSFPDWGYSAIPLLFIVTAGSWIGTKLYSKNNEIISHAYEVIDERGIFYLAKKLLADSKFLHKQLEEKKDLEEIFKTFAEMDATLKNPIKRGTFFESEDSVKRLDQLIRCAEELGASKYVFSWKNHLFNKIQSDRKPHKWFIEVDQVQAPKQIPVEQNNNLESQSVSIPVESPRNITQEFTPMGKMQFSIHEESLSESLYDRFNRLYVTHPDDMDLDSMHSESDRMDLDPPPPIPRIRRS